MCAGFEIPVIGCRLDRLKGIRPVNHLLDLTWSLTTDHVENEDRGRIALVEDCSMIRSPWDRSGGQLQGRCFTRLFALLPRCGRTLGCLAVGMFLLFGPPDAPKDRLRAAPVPKKKEEKFRIQLLRGGFSRPTYVYHLWLYGDGTLRDIDFVEVTYEGLRSSWSKATEDESLVLSVDDEKTTSVELLGKTLTRLREVSNPRIKTTVYVQLKSCAWEKPPTKKSRKK
jgi:hypothetical protein